MSETVKLYNPNDGVTGRANGTYLDLEQAKERENRSAKREKRKPDYDNLLSVGIPLHNESELRDRNYAPEVDIQAGEVEAKAKKHFEKDGIAEVNVSSESFKTSTAEEEKKFLDQGTKNRTDQGKEEPKTSSTNK